MTVTVGVDVGGTKVLTALVSRGTVLDCVEIPTDPRQGTRTLLDALGRFLSSHPEARAIGVGAAAWVEHPAGRVAFAPNLRYDDPDLKEAVETRFGLPVVVENDASAAAWAEHRFGAGRRSRGLVMVTVGTGIGGGIVIGGALQRGALGFAGEFGHMTVDTGGPPCACGERGCLEAMASGNAIGRMGRERGAGDSGEEVASMADEGDAIAKGIIQEAGRSLGIGLASLALAFDPELLVLGGGAAGARLVKAAVDEMHSRLSGRREPPPAVAAALGERAGAIGAAELAARALERRD